MREIRKYVEEYAQEIQLIGPKVTTEEVSNWWYLAPLFFVIIGGLIAYVANRDRNERKAKRFVYFGCFTAISMVLLIGAFGSNSLSF